MKVLVLGASTKPERMSFRVIELLNKAGHEVLAIGRNKGLIGEIPIESEIVNQTDVNTVTLYINPKIQPSYYEDIIALRPKRVIFNPGTENHEFCQLLRKNHIICEYACTLVLLTTGQFN